MPVSNTGGGRGGRRWGTLVVGVLHWWRGGFLFVTETQLQSCSLNKDIIKKKKKIILPYLSVPNILWIYIINHFIYLFYLLLGHTRWRSEVPGSMLRNCYWQARGRHGIPGIEPRSPECKAKPHKLCYHSDLYNSFLNPVTWSWNVRSANFPINSFTIFQEILSIS